MDGKEGGREGRMEVWRYGWEGGRGGEGGEGGR